MTTEAKQDHAEVLDQQGDGKEGAEFSPVLYQFTNGGPNPNLDAVLAMFYEGIYTNRIGIMQAFNLDSEEEELILVGVEPDEDGKPVCFPLCRVLTDKMTRSYMAPDGKGGFFDLQDPSASAAAREEMAPITEDNIVNLQATEIH